MDPNIFAQASDASEKHRIEVGQTFSTLEDVRKAVRDLARSNNWDARVADSDKSRTIMKCCRTPGCTFHLRANYNTARCEAEIVSLESEHTCYGAPPVARSNVAKMEYLLEEVPKLVEVTTNTSTRDLCSIVFKNLGGEIKLQQAQKLKKRLLQQDQAGKQADFAKVPEYLDALEAENEHCTTALYIADDGTFLRAFVAPPTGISVFSGSIPVLGLDGSHMRNGYIGTALFAVTRDLNNCILPYAWAVVESESTESWYWFLANLKRAVPYR